MMISDDSTTVLAACEYRAARLLALVERAQRLLESVPPLMPARANEAWQADVAAWLADAVKTTDTRR